MRANSKTVLKLMYNCLDNTCIVALLCVDVDPATCVYIEIFG